MKRVLFVVLVCAMLTPKATRAQTTLKGNVLYWAVVVLNLSAETALGGHVTLNADLVYSPWESIDGNKMRLGQAIATARWYPRGAFDGFFAGPYAALHAFRISKWGGYGDMGMYQVGNGVSLGAEVGYQWSIAPRWNMEASVAGGWQVSHYTGYESGGEIYAPWNGSGEWIPYKIGLTFCYKLGK